MAVRTQKLVPAGKLYANGKSFWLLDNKPEKRHDWANYGIHEFMVAPADPLTDDNDDPIYTKVMVEAADGGRREVSIHLYPSPCLLTTTNFTIQWGMSDNQVGYILCAPTDYNDIPVQETNHE
jgi:hypothetical protein